MNATVAQAPSVQAPAAHHFWCAACGHQMPPGVMHCPSCGLSAPSAMLNRYSLSLWVLILASNALYGYFILPALMLMQQSAGAKPSILTRLYLVFNPWVIAPIAIVLTTMTALKGKMPHLPKMVTSSRLVAVGTLITLVFTVAALFAGFIETLGYLPHLISTHR